MPYQLGLTEIGMVAATTWFGGFDPHSRYAPAGELVQAHSGELVEQGYPVSTWVIDGISVVNYAALRSGLSMTGYSAEVYIETRDEDDVYNTYRSLLRLPNPVTLERWSEHYQDVELEFVLLELIP